MIPSRYLALIGYENAKVEKVKDAFFYMPSFILASNIPEPG